jgi:hypothetical protein
MNTLTAILNGVTKDENDNILYFTFHASNAHLMNDKMEGALLLDKFFTRSKHKNEYHELFADMEKAEGEIYAISFCKSDDKTKDTGYIPMWGMYGDKGNGAILVFDYDSLKEYLSHLDSTTLCKCEYNDSKTLKILLKQKNQEAKNVEDKTAFLSNLRDEAFRLKDKHWEYEDEWRILTKSHDSKLKCSYKGVVSYTEIKIPVKCLKTIILGPLTDFDMCKNVLDMVISRLKEVDETIDQKINIKPSKLQMR